MNANPEDVTCDFLSYLEWRLGKDRDATAEMLGEWLAGYKRQRRGDLKYPIHFGPGALQKS